MKNLPLGMSGEIISYKYFKELYKNVEDPNSSEYMTWMLDRPDLCKVITFKDDEFNRPNYRLTCDTPDDFTPFKLSSKIYIVENQLAEM